MSEVPLYRDGPASGEYRRHLCRLGISGCFGVDAPNRGCASWGVKPSMFRAVTLPNIGVPHYIGVSTELPTHIHQTERHAGGTRPGSCGYLGSKGTYGCTYEA